jgi:hypothetical protein
VCVESRSTCVSSLCFLKSRKSGERTSGAVMIQVAVYAKTEEGAKWMDACHVLALVEHDEFVVLLQNINWEGDGKKRFLMGQVKLAFCEIAIPLSEEAADQAIREYRMMGYG